MTWQFPVYTPIFVLTVSLSLWLAFSVWQRRSLPGADVFAVMVLASCFWLFTRLLEAAAYEVWAKVFWAKTEYFGILVVSPAWFVFTCYYSRQFTRFPRRYNVLLSIMPLISLVLIWTNESHHLIWTTITRSTINPEVLNYGHGPWFWLIVIFNYTLLLAGVWNLIGAIYSLPPKYRMQARILLLGSLFPIVGNVLYIFLLSPVRGMDLSPFFMSVTTLLYWLTVFRYRLFDLRYVARATIIETMHDGMLIIDEKNHVVDANPSALQLLNTSKAIVGQDVDQTFAPYPAILALIMNPQPQPITLAVGDNLLHYLDVQVSELDDERGNPAGKLVILRDVTQRHMSEKIAFENAVEERRIDLLSQFIRDVSHEFKTPLSIINNSLYLMEKTTIPQQQQKRREVIQLQTQRLNYLISEMLTTVQLDADVPLEHVSIDLSTLLEATTQAQQSIFTAKQQRLVLNTSEKAVQIDGDLFMLQKALTNILQNASRYTPEGGTITITDKSQGEMATIDISDTGVGLSDDSKIRIFERFFRVDDAHSTPGFGLGLPIAQSIIEKHHGWIDVESTPGEGTTFTISIPQSVGEVITSPTLQLATT